MFLAKPQSRKGNLPQIPQMGADQGGSQSRRVAKGNFLAKPQGRKEGISRKAAGTQRRISCKAAGTQRGISREAAGTQRRISCKVLNQGKSSLSAGKQIVNSQIANQNLYIICNFNC